MSAKAIANQGLSLVGVTVFQFDAQGRFVERIDADRANLADGYWELQKAMVSRPGREPEDLRHVYGKHLPDTRACQRSPRLRRSRSPCGSCRR